MNRNHFWKFAAILFVVAWSLYEMYPPTARDLIQYFAERAVAQDEAFSKIVSEARTLQQQQPETPYDNLKKAIGTNDLTRYFPFFEAKDELEPNTFILNRVQREAAGRIRLGLDLQGGTSFLVRMDTNQMIMVEAVTNQATKEVTYVTNAPPVQEVQGALNHAVEVLRKRVDKFGVAEPVLQPQGSDRILIQLPGLSATDMENARTAIRKPAYLQFRLVHPRSSDLAPKGITEPGYEILKEIKRQPGGEKIVTPYLVKKRSELEGGIKRAVVMRDNMGAPEIDFTLEDNAAQIFARVTRQNVGQKLAIVLDYELQTAPNIQSPIENGNGRITGNYTEQESFQLANVLENPLKAPLSIEEERTVDPSLGRDSIASGMTASIIAAVGTFLFMLVFYFASGLVANLALTLNILFLMGFLCAIGSTLTMPGIAGIALTIGMAVDANVLIYERMREEIAAGKSLRGIISASYNKAFGTILDSNLTTVIAGVILIKFGTGPVQGFGITLTVGIFASVFTAFFVTRFIYDFLLGKGWLTRIRMLPLIKFPQFRFMNWGTPACIVSLLLIVAGLGYGVFYRGKDVLGVDFAGGHALTLAFAQRVDEDQLRSTLDKGGLGDASIGYQKNLTTGKETLQLVVPVGSGEKAEALMENSFPEAKFHVVGTDVVGATVGAEIQESAIFASLLAMFAILVYVAFRYEFSFAIASVVALLHDVLITLGIYFMWGGQLTAPMVAAVLTIIGYSINDKIVIMDRIREDLKLGVRGSFRELIDVALNQTLSRTIITGGAVILATLALLFFGGSVIRDFAFTFLVGIISGTYSSLLIASPILLRLTKGQRPKIGAPVASTPVVADSAVRP